MFSSGADGEDCFLCHFCVKSIRIPVTWSDHQGAAPNHTIDSAYVNRVKEVVDWAIADGLYVILDVHHDSWQWTGSPEESPGTSK